MRVELVFPAFMVDQPDKGIAIAEVARVTKTMYVINPKDVKILTGTVRFGGRSERRYWRKNGREVGTHYRIRTWRISRELTDTVEINEAQASL